MKADSVISDPLTSNNKSVITKNNIIPPASIEDIINGPKPKLVGVLEFGHKTGGFLVMMTEEQRKELNRKTRRHTYGSNLGRIMG